MTAQPLVYNERNSRAIQYFKDRWSHPIVDSLGVKTNLGVINELVEAIPVFVYDFPDLIKRWPLEFHTENAIFIPATALTPFYTDTTETDRYNQKYSHIEACDASDLFYIASCCISLVERHCKVRLKTAERESIMNEIYGRNMSYADTISRDQYADNVLGFISQEEVIKTLDEMLLGDKTVDIFREMDTSTTKITEVMFGCSELHDPKHAFHQFSNAIINQQTQSSSPIAINTNPDVAEFRKLYGAGTSLEQKAYANKIMSFHSQQTLDTWCKRLEANVYLNHDENLLAWDELTENLASKWGVFLSFLNEPEVLTSLNVLKIKISKMVSSHIEDGFRSAVFMQDEIFGETLMEAIDQHEKLNREQFRVLSRYVDIHLVSKFNSALGVKPVQTNPGNTNTYIDANTNTNITTTQIHQNTGTENFIAGSTVSVNTTSTTTQQTQSLPQSNHVIIKVSADGVQSTPVHDNDDMTQEEKQKIQSRLKEIQQHLNPGFSHSHHSDNSNSSDENVEPSNIHTPKKPF
jgi:hypothetical protein